MKNHILMGIMGVVRMMEVVGVMTFLLIGCQKEIVREKCGECLYISEKRDIGRVDTLWKDVVCGRWLDSVNKMSRDTITLCLDNRIEITYYVIKPL